MSPSPSSGATPAATQPVRMIPRHDWSRAETLATFASLVLFWLTLSWPWLSGLVTIPWDAKAHFQPQFSFLARSLAAGQSPFWNPHVFAGHPQIADPQALIFSPLHLLAALILPRPGFVVGDAIVLVMLLAGAAAFVALFRDRGWAPAGAIVAGLVFAFGGVAAWRLQHTGQIMSLAWFAIALWLLARALGRRSGGYGALAGIAAGLMLTGRDQVALLGAYALAAMVLAAWLQSVSPLRAVLRSLWPLAASAVMVVMVAAVPLAMTWLLAGESNRPAIDLAGAHLGSLHPAALVSLVVANLFGAAGPFEATWGPGTWAWKTAFGTEDLYLARNMIVAYLGALPLLVLVGLGVLRGRAWDGPVRAVSLLALLTGLYALGRYTPFFALAFEWLPGVSLYRRPADALFNLGALLALLSGYLVHVHVTGQARTGEQADRMAETVAPRRARGPWIATAVLLVMVLGTAFVLASLVGRERVAMPALLTASLCLLLSGAVAWVLPRFHARTPIAAMLLAASVLAIDLAVHNGPNESTALPPAGFEVLRSDSTDPALAALGSALARETAPDRRDRVELAGIDFHWPNASMVHGLDHTLGYNPLRLGDFSRATGATDHVALPDQRQFAPLMPGYRSMMSNLLGLRYIVTRGPVAAIDKTLSGGDLPVIGRFGEGSAQIVIHENPEALPRVVAVGAAIRADQAQLLASGQWPAGFDPRRAVVVDGAGPATDDCAGTGAAGQARLVAYGTAEVVIETDMPTCGWLVLHDVWHRWWRAEVNGQDVAILRANGLFRAVAVPAGLARVRFAFAPLQGLWRDLQARLRRNEPVAPMP